MIMFDLRIILAICVSDSFNISNMCHFIIMWVKGYNTERFCY